MSFVPLQIPSGVVKTRSGEGAAGRWYDADNIRFVAGKPQKRAGFSRLNATLMLGMARGMEAWNKINGGPLFSIGTHIKLYGTIDGLDVIDITPLRFQKKWTSQLTTLLGKGGVSVHQVLHGFAVGKQFKIYGGSFYGGSTVGGILLPGTWEIVSATTDDFVLYPTSQVGVLGANPFTTVNLSAVVTVAHAAHGRKTGDAVFFSGATAGNGITIAGEYAITVLTSGTYTITHTAAATAGGAMGGAAVAFHYGAGATSAVALGGSVVPYYTNLANPFTTINLSPLVTVNHAGHGAKVRDNIIISGAVAVGGLLLAGAYTITSITDVDNFVITAAANATSGATGGGTAVLIEYEISTGPADKITAARRGFGTGALGAGFFGASNGVVSDALYFDPRTWAIDNAGEDAIISPLAGTIYYWDSSVGGRADEIPNAPTLLRYMFMTEERHIIALGINGDPMLLGWCTQGVFDDWVPTSTNTANNGRRVREGSALIAGTPVGGGVNLIWTDTALYVHQYTGSKFIYDTRVSMTDCGLLAPQAFARTPKGVIWMSQNRFKMWNGSVSDVPNSSDVDTWVFGNLDPDQKGKCFAHYDSVNNSVDFYYVPTGGAEPTLYVTVCLDDWSWTPGTQTRTTGSTFDSGGKNPLRVNGGILYKHEVGIDANGAAAPFTLSLAPYNLNKGFSELLGIDPDFKRQVGDVNISVRTYDRNPNLVEDTDSAVIAVGDEIADLHSEGRQISLTFSQTLLGGDWAMDTPQIDVKTRGNRR